MAEIITPSEFSWLESISSVDGRFRGRTEMVSDYFSESATIKGRAFVEIEYLIALLDVLGTPLTTSQMSKLRDIVVEFSRGDALRVWQIDEKINHDTKAVEYYLADRLKAAGLNKFRNYLHLGITSADVDNTALALSIKDFKDVILLPTVDKLIETLSALAEYNRSLVMLARTHGQPAVPTTAGKEMANFVARIRTQRQKLFELKIGSKITGAVGNHNALVAAYPDIDWTAFSERFLKRLGLASYSMTTQVEPYDQKIEFMQAIKRLNLVLQALSKDIWAYISVGFISMKDDEGHVGSSTMPQKINPIGFEAAEAYTLLSNGMLDSMISHLPTNRWQRDLTDKYMLRELGQPLAMTVFALDSATKSLSQIGFNKGVIDRDLSAHWETIAEAIQTILRAEGFENPYELVKQFTRGRDVDEKSFELFIDSLDVSDTVKDRLRRLSPQTNIGLADNFSELMS